MSLSFEKWQLCLSRALERKRLGHALMLVSESETAKKSAAHYYAKLLLCERQKMKGTKLPCNSCSDCTQVSLDKHVNVEWVGVTITEPIRIDQVRELKESLRLRAFSDKPRLIVLANAHALTTGAANALLKSLEEPGANQYFLVLATSRFAIPQTLLSRCQTLSLKTSDELLHDTNADVTQFAKSVLARIRESDLAGRIALVEEITKHSCDKASLLLEVQKQLHNQLRASPTFSAQKRKELFLKPIEATEASRALLERNVNVQLTLENWLLKSWNITQE